MVAPSAATAASTGSTSGSASAVAERDRRARDPGRDDAERGQRRR